MTPRLRRRTFGYQLTLETHLSACVLHTQGLLSPTLGLGRLHGEIDIETREKMTTRRNRYRDSRENGGGIRFIKPSSHGPRCKGIWLGLKAEFCSFHSGCKARKLRRDKDASKLSTYPNCENESLPMRDCVCFVAEVHIDVHSF
jgi:hypothetical protein